VKFLKKFAVAPDSPIDLQAGEPDWLKLLRLILIALALLSLMLASSAVSFRLIALASLAIMTVFIYRQRRRQTSIERLRVYGNGTVTLVDRVGLETPAMLDDGAWTMCGLSVLPVGRFDRWQKQRLLISLSRNHPDNYRRLLIFLRLGSAVDKDDGILGSS
jgi:hypothetical protein